MFQHWTSATDGHVSYSSLFFFKLTFIYNNVCWKAFGKLLEDSYKLLVDSKWHTLLFLTQLSRVDSLPILLNKWIVIYAGAVCSHYRLGYINSNSITQTAVPEMTYCLTLMLDVWLIFANVMSFSKGLSPRILGGALIWRVVWPNCEMTPSCGTQELNSNPTNWRQPYQAAGLLKLFFWYTADPSWKLHI